MVVLTKTAKVLNDSCHFRFKLCTPVDCNLLPNPNAASEKRDVMCPTKHQVLSFVNRQKKPSIYEAEEVAIT